MSPGVGHSYKREPQIIELIANCWIDKYRGYTQVETSSTALHWLSSIALKASMLSLALVSFVLSTPLSHTYTALNFIDLLNSVPEKALQRRHTKRVPSDRAR